MKHEHSNEPDSNELIETIDVESFDDILALLPLEIEINNSPILISFSLITLLALSGGCFWLYTTLQEILILCLGIIFGFLLLAVIYALAFKKRPKSLRVSKEGFLISSNTQSEPTPWKDFEYFNLTAVNYVKLVVFQHTKESGRKRTVGGYTLPRCRDFPPLALAVILDSCREYFTTGKKPEDFDDEEIS